MSEKIHLHYRDGKLKQENFMTLIKQSDQQ